MATITAHRLHMPVLLAQLLMAAVALLMLFVVAFDQGQLAQLAQLAQAGSGDTLVHESFHDARHILGFPCH